MFLPVGDSPNPSQRPWINWALIAVNVVVFLALWPLSQQHPALDDPALLDYVRVVTAERVLPREALLELASSLTRYDLLVFRWGFRPAEPGLLNLLAAMFLHGGLMHLLGNMLFLWIFGDNVEAQLGRLGYLAAYLGTGAAAALGDALIRHGSGIPSVGASGAISGVLGCYLIWFPHNAVRVFVVLFPIYIGTIEFSARFVLILYILADNVLPLVLQGGDGGVSYGAHIGGFFAGATLALAWNQLQERTPAPPSARPPAERVVEARRAFSEGRVGDSAQLLVGLPRQATREFTPADLIAAGRELEERGQRSGALRVYRQALTRARPGDPFRGEAHLGVARVLIAQGLGTSAYQHLHELILGRDATPGQRDQARALLARLEGLRRLPRRLG